MRTPLPHVLLLTARGVLSCVRGVRRKGMVVTSVDGKVPANSDEAISMVTSKSRPLTLGAAPSACCHVVRWAQAWVGAGFNDPEVMVQSTANPTVRRLGLEEEEVLSPQ